MRSALEECKRNWVAREFDRPLVLEVRRSIVVSAAGGSLSDFGSAEQALLAIDYLTTYVLKDRARYDAAIDVLYKSVEERKSYRPDRFESAARDLLGAMRS